MWILHKVHKNPLISFSLISFSLFSNQTKPPTNPGSLTQHRKLIPASQTLTPKSQTMRSCTWTGSWAHGDSDTQLSNALGWWHTQDKTYCLGWGMADIAAQKLRQGAWAPLIEAKWDQPCFVNKLGEEILQKSRMPSDTLAMGAK